MAIDFQSFNEPISLKDYAIYLKRFEGKAASRVGFGGFDSSLGDADSPFNRFGDSVDNIVCFFCSVYTLQIAQPLLRHCCVFFNVGLKF